MTENYLQINIGGRLRGWKINQMTIEIWSTMIDEDAWNSTSMYAGMYGGLRANCKIKSEEPDFTFENVCDWVDELYSTDEGTQTLENVKKLFEGSMVYVNFLKKMSNKLKEVQEILDGPDKKKEPETTSP